MHQHFDMGYKKTEFFKEIMYYYLLPLVLNINIDKLHKNENNYYHGKID